MNTKDFSTLQEKQIAKFLGGRTQANSGGTKFGGGDVHTRRFLIEAKTPSKARDSVTIRLEWITKAAEQAFEQGKPNSALAIRFDPEGKDYYVIDEKLMRTLVHVLEDTL